MPQGWRGRQALRSTCRRSRRSLSLSPRVSRCAVMRAQSRSPADESGRSRQPPLSVGPPAPRLDLRHSRSAPGRCDGHGGRQGHLDRAAGSGRALEARGVGLTGHQFCDLYGSMIFQTPRQMGWSVTVGVSGNADAQGHPSPANRFLQVLGRLGPPHRPHNLNLGGLLVRRTRPGSR